MNGKVVGIEDFVIETVIDFVLGKLVGIEEGEREYVGDIE